MAYATCWYEIEVGIAGRDVASCGLRAIEGGGCRTATGSEVGKIGGGSMGMDKERQVYEQEKGAKKGSQGRHNGIAVDAAGAHKSRAVNLTRKEKGPSSTSCRLYVCSRGGPRFYQGQLQPLSLLSFQPCPAGDNLLYHVGFSGLALWPQGSTPPCR